MIGLHFALVTLYLLGATLAKVVTRKEVNPKDLGPSNVDSIIDAPALKDIDDEDVFSPSNVDSIIDAPALKDIDGGDVFRPSNVASIIDGLGSMDVGKRDHYIAPAHRDIADADGLRKSSKIIESSQLIDPDGLRRISQPIDPNGLRRQLADSLRTIRDFPIFLKDGSVSKISYIDDADIIRQVADNPPALKDIDDADGLRRRIADILRTHKDIDVPKIRYIGESSQHIDSRNLFGLGYVSGPSGIYLKDGSDPSNVASIIDERDHYIVRTLKDIDVPKIRYFGESSQHIDSRNLFGKKSGKNLQKKK